jgi:hypothetical protein
MLLGKAERGIALPRALSRVTLLPYSLFAIPFHLSGAIDYRVDKRARRTHFRRTSHASEVEMPSGTSRSAPRAAE